MTLLDPEKVKYIIIHCSASNYGDVETITEWHKSRGWTTVGYHHIICNAYPKYHNYKYKQPDIAYDGLVQKGRSEQFRGAHVKGYNWQSIGVCIIGEGVYSSRQLESTTRLCYEIMSRFPNKLEIKGHNNFTDKKTCPILDIEHFVRVIMPLVDTNVDGPIFDPSILGRF